MAGYYKLMRQLMLLGLVTLQTLIILNLHYRVRKAETCNVVFVTYFRDVYGITINLDKMYENARLWVGKP